MTDERTGSAVATTQPDAATPGVAHDATPPHPARHRAVTWRDLRDQTGLSLRQLEEVAGINRGEISRIERGRACPSPEQARKLLAVYGHLLP